MPYISNKNNRREEMDAIVFAIGSSLDILGDKVSNWETIKGIVKTMIKLDVKVNGDLNYILYALCKRYVEPSYNNYKKYLTKLNRIGLGDLSGLLCEFMFEIIKNLINYDLIKENFDGELQCCAFEIYRKIVAPYEELKEKQNGDVT